MLVGNYRITYNNIQDTTVIVQYREEVKSYYYFLPFAYWFRSEIAHEEFFRHEEYSVSTVVANDPIFGTRRRSRLVTRDIDNKKSQDIK